MLKAKCVCHLIRSIFPPAIRRSHPKSAALPHVWRQNSRCYSSQSTQFVQVERDSVNQDIAWLKLNRKPVNSLNFDMLTEFAKSMDIIENDESYKGIILTSAIPGIFCAGLEIFEMYQKTPEYYGQFWNAVQELWLRVYGSSLPVIAAINGQSPAGGCFMAIGCDYRIMATGKYIIGLNEVALGVVPEIMTTTLLRILNHRQTEMALQLGTLFPVDKAVATGLVDQAVALENLEEAARTEMTKWIKIPAHARNMTKQMMHAGAIERVQRNRQKDIEDFANMVCQPKVQATIGRYLESLKTRNK